MTTQQKPILPERVFDFDALVHEDRVHRSLYTDPAIFDLEMTRIFGAVWVYLAHESQVPQPNDFVRARLGLPPAHRGARFERRPARALQPLHPPRRHRLPAGQGLGQGVPVPLSRLDLPQHRQALRRALARGLQLRLFPARIQPDAGAAGRELPRPDLRHPERRRARADRLSRPGAAAARRMARPPSRRRARSARGQPAEIQRQLEAALRQFGRRLSRRLLPPLAADDGEPLPGGRRQGYVLLQGQPGHRAGEALFLPQRPSLQGQARRDPEAPGRPVGDRGPASRHGALRGGPAPGLPRPGGRFSRPRVVGAGQHQRVSEPAHPWATISRSASPCR